MLAKANAAKKAGNDLVAANFYYEAGLLNAFRSYDASCSVIQPQLTNRMVNDLADQLRRVTSEQLPFLSFFRGGGACEMSLYTVRTDEVEKYVSTRFVKHETEIVETQASTRIAMPTSSFTLPKNFRSF